MHELKLFALTRSHFSLLNMTLLLLSVDQLAEVMHKSASSVRSDASRNPDALPPICRLPGNKRLLWREEDVTSWIACHVQGAVKGVLQHAPISTSKMTKKRGRPRKTAPAVSSR